MQEDSYYCPECGFKFHDPPFLLNPDKDEYICPNCDRYYDPDAKYCKVCGHELSDDFYRIYSDKLKNAEDEQSAVMDIINDYFKRKESLSYNAIKLISTEYDSVDQELDPYNMMYLQGLDTPELEESRKKFIDKKWNEHLMKLGEVKKPEGLQTEVEGLDELNYEDIDSDLDEEIN